MVIVSWDRRRELYAQRVADALPLLLFQPTYHSLKLSRLTSNCSSRPSISRTAVSLIKTSLRLRNPSHLAKCGGRYVSRLRNIGGRPNIPLLLNTRPMHKILNVRRSLKIYPLLNAAQPRPNAQVTQSLLVSQPLPTVRFMSTAEATQPTRLAQPLPTVQSTPTAQASQSTSRITGPVPDPFITCLIISPRTRRILLLTLAEKDIQHHR